MKKNIFLSFVFCAFLFSCQKEDNLLTDRNYPTIIKELDNSILNQKRLTFQQQNKYINTSLNRFGFCDVTEFNSNISEPQVTDPLSLSDANQKVKDFCMQNKAFVGLNDVNSFTLAGQGPETGFYDNSLYWYFGTSSQKIDTNEVLGAQIRVIIKNSEIVYCTGNWYPNIYIPKHFNFDQEKAKSTLRNQTVWHSDISGQSHPTKITDQALASCQINGLKIYPVKSDDKIQLFVTWKIHVTDVYYILYIDVMTGEVIAAEPTIIS